MTIWLLWLWPMLTYSSSDIYVYTCIQRYTHEIYYSWAVGLVNSRVIISLQKLNKSIAV